MNYPLIIRRIGLLLICLISGFFAGYREVQARTDSTHFPEKANLALRRTAHHLLKQNGDSTSRILPVQQLDANTFVVRMDQLFDYDQLPRLLQESLQLHGIKRTYDVTILDCHTNEILLGYSQQDLFQNEGIPCNSRKQEPGCYQLQVSFHTEATTNAASSWWILPLGTVLLGLVYIAWHRNRRTTPAIPNPPTDSATVPFSNSVWDPTMLRLISGESSHQLTYREAKLLNLLLAHQNQVLERDFILKAVWEDEGIVVGRSLDVFISRLRKMLVNDAGIKLVAVHGIGYRLEVLA
jgi:hypothetical protein